jgi:hypothetical protein
MERQQLLERQEAKVDVASEQGVLRRIFDLTVLSRMWHGCRPVEKNRRRLRK